MFSFTAPGIYHHPAVSSVSSGSNLRSQDITLILRQQPKEALVTTEGKEKARKPVDPPPIIQLQVKPQADPAQHFLQSPYLFMCTSLFKVEKNEAWDGNANRSLAGSLVSSLHRLKDVDNKDGGFFVFGDISVKVQGTFRLHFSLFDLRKDTSEVQYLGSITSEPFKVLLPKDFKGMDESTYLSRAFSDQGVRLRLRKEPRAMMGNKRPYPYGADTPVSSSHVRPSEYSYDDSTSPNKRFRSDTVDEMKREPYTDQTTTSYSSSPFQASQYPVRQHSLTGMQSIGQYPNYSGVLTSGSSSPFQFRAPSIGNSSGYISDPLLSTSSTTTIGSTVGGSMPTQQRYPDLQHSYANFLPPYDTPNVSAMGLDHEHRPATATGIPPSMSMAQQTAHTVHSSHPSHETLGSSRGASYSHSPELLRAGGFSDRYQLGSQLPDPNRSAGRYEDPSQMHGSLYSHQRNTLPALPTESNLTSHTDSGALPTSLHYTPDLSQSGEEHGSDPR